MKKVFQVDENGDPHKAVITDVTGSFRWTPEILKEIETMAGFGLTGEQICAAMRFNMRDVMDPPGVFDKAVYAGKSKAYSMIMRSLFQRAMSGETPAIKLWLTETSSNTKPDDNAGLVSKDTDQLKRMAQEALKSIKIKEVADGQS